MCFDGKFTASQTVPAYAAPVRQSVRRAWCKDRIHHLPSTTDHRYSTPHQDHHHRSRSSIMRSRRDDHHLGRAASMIAFLGSVRALAATRRYANIRGARHHGLDRGPVGDDETRIPHRPRLHESFQLLGSYGHVREVPHAVITAAPVQGRGCCACLVGIEHGPCGDCAYCPRSSPCRALMIFIQHATWRCVASSGAAGAAGHSVTESRRGRTTRNKHPFANAPFVHIGAQIILHTLLLDNF